jgi:hypothetical protein
LVEVPGTRLANQSYQRKGVSARSRLVAYLNRDSQLLRSKSDGVQRGHIKKSTSDATEHGERKAKEHSHHSKHAHVKKGKSFSVNQREKIAQGEGQSAPVEGMEAFLLFNLLLLYFVCYHFIIIWLNFYSYLATATSPPLRLRRTQSEENPVHSLIQKKSDLAISAGTDNKEEAKKKMIERLQIQIMKKSESMIEVSNPSTDAEANQTNTNANHKNDNTKSSHKTSSGANENIPPVENSASEASRTSHEAEPRAIFRIDRDRLPHRNSQLNPNAERKRNREMLLNQYVSQNISPTEVLDYEVELSPNSAILSDRLKTELQSKLDIERKVKLELEMKLEAEKKIAEEIHYERVRISEKILLEKTLAEDRVR